MFIYCLEANVSINLAVDPSFIPNAPNDTKFQESQSTAVERLYYEGEDLQWLTITCSDPKSQVLL